jgi:hypothetical protein
LDPSGLLVVPLDCSDRLGRKLGRGSRALRQFVGLVVGLPGHWVDTVSKRLVQGPVSRNLHGFGASVSDGRPETLPLEAVTLRHAYWASSYSSEYVCCVDVELEVPFRAKGELRGCFQLC